MVSNAKKHMVTYGILPFSMENLSAPAGRIYFHVLGSSELLAAARSVEMMGVLLLRHSDDPLGATGWWWWLGASAKRQQMANLMKFHEL